MFSTIIIFFLFFHHYITLHLSHAKSCFHEDVSNTLKVTNKSFHPSQLQLLRHCNQSNYEMKTCNRVWLSKRKLYVWNLNDHYKMLNRNVNHSIRRMNTKIYLNTSWKAKVERKKTYLVDLMIDLRCFHSWPYNPYHKIADCLVFILPTIYHHFRSYYNIKGTNHLILKSINFTLIIFLIRLLEIISKSGFDC
jgi:hypothetical protein